MASPTRKCHKHVTAPGASIPMECNVFWGVLQYLPAFFFNHNNWFYDNLPSFQVWLLAAHVSLKLFQDTLVEGLSNTYFHLYPFYHALSYTLPPFTPHNLQEIKLLTPFHYEEALAQGG